MLLRMGILYDYFIATSDDEAAQVIDWGGQVPATRLKDKHRKSMWKAESIRLFS
jgi:hypothetical protein